MRATVAMTASGHVQVCGDTTSATCSNNSRAIHEIITPPLKRLCPFAKPLAHVVGFRGRRQRVFLAEVLRSPEALHPREKSQQHQGAISYSYLWVLLRSLHSALQLRCGCTQIASIWLTSMAGLAAHVVTVHRGGTSQVPRGGEMVPPLLDENLLHLSCHGLESLLPQYVVEPHLR
jgi:hypothetical protein